MSFISPTAKKHEIKSHGAAPAAAEGDSGLPYFGTKKWNEFVSIIVILVELTTIFALY
jgi:hypothetical protein